MFAAESNKASTMHLITLIRFLILIVLAFLSMCGNKINNKMDIVHSSQRDSLVVDFASIINAYKSIQGEVKASSYSYKKDYLSFDFSKLSQSDEVNAKGNRFEVYFSQKGDVSKIIKYDKNFMDLRFDVVERHGFTVFIVHNNENGARYNGFIFSYRGKLYYLNSSKTTDSFLWEADSEYSTIMELDSRLEARFIYKFYKDRLLYKSSVTYNANGKLDEEYYNVCREVIKIDQTTSFTDFQKSVNKQQSFLYLAKSKYIIEGGQTLNQPLWTYEGEHTGILTN